MHPTLLRIGELEIGSYGVALAAAFALGIAFAFRRASARGLDAEIVIDVGIVALVSALLGARAFHLWLHPEIVTGPDGSWWRAFLPIGVDGRVEVMGGLSVMGGLPAALGASVAWLAWKRVPLLVYADVMAPSVALGAGITRIGCFFNGCCFGRVCDWPWAVSFPPGSLPDRALGAVSVHPTQLYAVIAGLVLFAALLWVDGRTRLPGVTFFALIAGMGLQRFAIEFFRHNERVEQAVVGLSVYQLAALGLVVVGTGGIAWAIGAAPRSASDRPPG